MNRRIAGRIGTGALTGVGVIMVVLLLGLFVFNRQSISEGGAQFMSALAKGDVKELVATTSLGSDSPEVVERKWKRTLDRSRNYLFVWRMESSSVSPDGQRGAVRLQVSRNAGTSSSYEEKFELPMVQKNGKWIVEVDGISREMFPFLPRASRD